jgi:outer membrane murein-binding lipoprotein Lpp
MQLSTTVASSAVVIGFLVVAGYANSQDAAAGATAQQTWQAKVEAREAQRRVALEDHKKLKEDFARRCAKSQPMTTAQLQDCRAMYRKL